MIEGPDPVYQIEFDQIPPELIEFMDAGYDVDDRDLIADMVGLPLEERRELYAKIKKFLSLPPTEFQLFAIASTRGFACNPGETMAVIHTIRDHLELSLQAAPGA
ncbi:MAG TPA: hypothetical protein PLA94_24965 [Myxococcota bacterium]|nr:hypothetical protein [Myxococcota bacterium]